jgi:hypothetical protein
MKGKEPSQIIYNRSYQRMSINMKEQKKRLDMNARVAAFRKQLNDKRKKSAGKIDLTTGESK